MLGNTVNSHSQGWRLQLTVISIVQCRLDSNQTTIMPQVAIKQISWWRRRRRDGCTFSPASGPRRTSVLNSERPFVRWWGWAFIQRVALGSWIRAGGVGCYPWGGAGFLDRVWWGRAPSRGVAPGARMRGGARGWCQEGGRGEGGRWC